MNKCVCNNELILGLSREVVRAPNKSMSGPNERVDKYVLGLEVDFTW